MLVYGDGVRRTTIGAAATELRDRARLAGILTVIARHAALSAGMIAAGELWQGLADADGEAVSPEQTAVAALAREFAAALIASWRSGFVTLPPSLDLSQLPDAAADRVVELRRPEGYAFYALYPEAYAEAALASGLPAGARVVGIRSIGTGLAAVVAAALGAEPPLTVRPSGDPFARRLEPSPALDAAVQVSPDADWAIVDEGPGLSGSSFGAVADALEARAVDRSRLAFFPSHPGDLGPQASEAHRTRWFAARRPYMGFDDLVLHASDPSHRLQTWVETLVGPLSEPLTDISGGAWRGRVYADEADWPPVNAWQERRKFLARTGAGAWLVKFVGLGRYGEAALRRAQAVHAAGFGLEPAGLAYGFLVRRWREDVRPLASRPEALEGVAAYLATRTSLPADPGDGASLDELLVMARRNTELGLGADAAGAWDRWAGRLDELSVRVRPAQTDNRLQPWEWLADGEGRLFKADETDHCAAHDLIGCQDPAWDVAGAISEFELNPDEAEGLRRAVGRAAGREIDPDLLAFLQLAYEAFQLGWWTLARDAHAGWPEEHARLAARVDVHRARLAARLPAM